MTSNPQQKLDTLACATCALLSVLTKAGVNTNELHIFQERMNSRDRLNLFDFICSEPEFLGSDAAQQVGYDEDGYDLSEIDKCDGFSDAEKSIFKEHAKERLDELQNEVEAYGHLPIFVYPHMSPRVVQVGVYHDCNTNRDCNKDRQLFDLSGMGTAGLIEWLRAKDLLPADVKLDPSGVVIVGHDLSSESSRLPSFLVHGYMSSDNTGATGDFLKKLDALYLESYTRETQALEGHASSDKYLLYQAVAYAHAMATGGGMLEFFRSHCKKKSLEERSAIANMFTGISHFIGRFFTRTASLGRNLPATRERVSFCCFLTSSDRIESHLF